MGGDPHPWGDQGGPWTFSGPQYDSGNDEFPLDAFDEYIKVEESDRDSNVVYICTAREMSPSQTKDLISLTDTGSVSEDPITTETEIVSAMNPVAPRDLSPQELLLILPEDKCLKIYYQCKDEENPNWVSQYCLSWQITFYEPRSTADCQWPGHLHFIDFGHKWQTLHRTHCENEYLRQSDIGDPCVTYYMCILFLFFLYILLITNAIWSSSPSRFTLISSSKRQHWSRHSLSTGNPSKRYRRPHERTSLTYYGLCTILHFFYSYVAHS